MEEGLEVKVVMRHWTRKLEAARRLRSKYLLNVVTSNRRSRCTFLVIHLLSRALSKRKQQSLKRNKISKGVSWNIMRGKKRRATVWGPRR